MTEPGERHHLRVAGQRLAEPGGLLERDPRVGVGPADADRAAYFAEPAHDRRGVLGREPCDLAVERRLPHRVEPGFGEHVDDVVRQPVVRGPGDVLAHQGAVQRAGHGREDGLVLGHEPEEGRPPGVQRDDVEQEQARDVDGLQEVGTEGHRSPDVVRHDMRPVQRPVPQQRGQAPALSHEVDVDVGPLG